MVKYQMKLIKSMQFLVLMCLLFSGLVSTVPAAEQSVCITCHLDETMLTENLSKAVTKTSAMQSGSG